MLKQEVQEETWWERCYDPGLHSLQTWKGRQQHQAKNSYKFIGKHKKEYLGDMIG